MQCRLPLKLQMAPVDALLLLSRVASPLIRGRLLMMHRALFPIPLVALFFRQDLLLENAVPMQPPLLIRRPVPLHPLMKL